MSRGIKNVGNSCFANSAVQCLYNTTDFCNQLLLLQERREAQGTIALQEAFAMLLFSNQDSIDITPALEHLRPAWFVAGEQQDTAEFLLHALEVLHTAEKSLVAPEETFVDDSFGAKLYTSSIYTCCDRASRRDEQTRSISLSFSTSSDLDQKYSVQSQLDAFLSPELLTGDERVSCEQCNRKVDVIKQHVIIKPPKNLILTLNIFCYDQELADSRKIAVKVSYEEIISMTVGTVPDQRTVDYKLYAVILHSGSSANRGHYTAVTRDDGDWKTFNDEYVTPFSLHQLQTIKRPSTPYILFYKAIGDFPETAKPDFKDLPRYLQDSLFKTYANEKKN